MQQRAMVLFRKSQCSDACSEQRLKKKFEIAYLLGIHKDGSDL